MAWAYATATEDRPRLFEGIAAAAMARSGDFSPQGVSMLLWAFAAAGHSDRRLFDAFAPRAAALLHDCNSQALANIAWAYAVADVDADTLFGGSSAFISALAEKTNEFDHQGLGQLHQWNLWRKERAATDGVLPPALEKICYEHFTDPIINCSQLQTHVMSELVSLGLSPEEEFLTESGYRLDALLDVNGTQVGVEVDGPSHFVGKNLSGSTLLKRRQVYNIDGIKIASLPYWELNFLKSSDQKQRYLKDKLGMGGLSLPKI
jgi:hypothetical protein